MFKYVYKLGQLWRNPSLKKWYAFLKNTEQWSLKELQEYQYNQLHKILSVAYETPFYCKKFEELNLRLSHIKNMEDLKLFPITTKEELITFNKENHSNFKSSKQFKAATSGTSGQSLEFLREESADSFTRASIFRGYSWYQTKPWERNAYLWGFQFSLFAKLKLKCLDALQNRFRIFSFRPDELKKYLKKLKKTRYIHGYSSHIFEVAKYYNKFNSSPINGIKLVKGTSEKIYPIYQEEIIKAFGHKMISEYGAAETGIIAFECPKGNMHINMEGVIVEEINGEIIVTNLQLLSFPIIRYKLGDYIKLAPKEKKCKCGLNHLILEEVTGRVGNLVYGFSVTYPSLYFYYIFKNLTKKDLTLTYQVIQNSKGKLLFLIEQNLKTSEKELLRREVKRYFKDDMTIEITDGATFVKSKHKHRSFISNIV